MSGTRQNKVVNGTELASLTTVFEAFSYLKKDYNDGNITKSLGGDAAIITARGGRFQHFGSLQDSQDVKVVDAFAKDDGRLKLTVKES